MRANPPGEHPSAGYIDRTGAVLIRLQFLQAQSFSEGLAPATSLITDQRGILAEDTYTEITGFDHGVAWASHRWTDHRGAYQREGWGLIDTSARELSELKYVRADWIWSPGDTYAGNISPSFYGELAPIVLAEGYQRSGERVWNLNSWGYINRAGKIVAWHEGQTAGASAH